MAEKQRPGGAQIKAKGEWMISLKKRSGDYQAVVGLAVEQVTVDFPQVNLSGAVDAIKAAVPKNKFIQSCNSCWRFCGYFVRDSVRLSLPKVDTYVAMWFRHL